MNMVALLVVPLVMPFDRSLVDAASKMNIPFFLELQKHAPGEWVRWVVVAVSLAALIWAVARSKAETEEMKAVEDELTGA